MLHFLYAFVCLMIYFFFHILYFFNLRSEARLQKLGEKIYSDAIRPGATEEDTSINILSDGETLGNHIWRDPRNELQKKASPIKKRLEIHPVEVNEESKQGRLNLCTCK